MTPPNAALAELPEPIYLATEYGTEADILGYTADQMREYALAALLAEPGEAVKVLCHRLHQPNYSSEWISGDYTGPESTQRGWSVERAYSLARCEAVAVKAHGYMQELEAVKAELASKRINRVDAMAWRLLNNQHLRDVLTRAADAEDQSAVGCLRRLDLILSRDTHPAAPEGVSARFFASGPEGEFFTGSHAFAETLLAAAGRDRDEWTITDLQEPRKP